MNRSILLVICDFLILTLLSFVQFDSTSNESASQSDTSTQRSMQVSAPAMTNMVATLASALELERQQRDAISSALATNRAELERKLQLLAEREQNLSNAQQRLTVTETEARRLAEERSRLEKSQNEAQASVQSLQKAFETTRQGSENLQARLTDSTREAAEAKARLEMLQVELTRRQQEAQEMSQRMAKLNEAADALKGEKQQLLVDLRQTEVEARHARGEVSNLNERLTVVNLEKAQLAATAAQLATNVGSLAEKSSAIQEQIERQIRLPANTIYGDFISNRVETTMTGTTRGGLGQEVNRDRKGACVLMKSGGNLFAVIHLESAAIRIWPPDAPWSALGVELKRGQTKVQGSQFAMLRDDPRVIVIPISPGDAEVLGARVYEVCTDPAQFAEAVVVGAEERYYGETAFQLSSESPGYIEMERSTFRRLLGEFSPKKGDLVFTRTGLLLGVMVNGDRCRLLDKFETLQAFRCGTQLNVSQNSQILRNAFAILEKQPYPLR
ncbi:MAG: hypothetical protein IT581_00865 [Verrucomicrobiales bacterium]|nr:hypothetical protein [Verrucomicrobiales bacterium]